MPVTLQDPVLEQVRREAPGPTAGPPAADLRRARNRRWRNVKDRTSQVVVAVGGISVIVALGLIFLFLFLAVLPLLRPADVDARASYTAPGGGEAASLHLAAERHLDVAVRFTADARAVFFDPADGRVLDETRMPLPDGAAVTSFAIGELRTRIVAYGLGDGTALVVRHAYAVTFPDDTRLVTPSMEFPLGRTPSPWTRPAAPSPPLPSSRVRPAASPSPRPPTTAACSPGATRRGRRS